MCSLFQSVHHSNAKLTSILGYSYTLPADATQGFKYLNENMKDYIYINLETKMKIFLNMTARVGTEMQISIG